jgi:hypothetical protein
MSKFLESLLGKLVGVFVGIAMIGGGIYYSLKKEDNFGKEFKRPSSAIELVDKRYNINLRNEFEKSISEKLRIKAELDKEKNILYFGCYTQDYNKENWTGTKKEPLPLNKRHTNINNTYSRTFILHPENIEISTEQKVFLIPQYKWDNNLKTYEEHKEAQMVIKGGNKILNWGISKIPIPFSKEMFEEFIGYSDKKKREHYRELFEKINKNYVVTTIPPNIPNKIIGHTQTAREYKIQFDMNNTNGEVPMYLWTKIALGDPSKASHGSFPNKYGELEGILIEFNLKRRIEESKRKNISNFPPEETVKKDLEEYFFQGKELEYVKLAPKKFTKDIVPENPYIFPAKNFSRKELLLLNINSKGFARYIMSLDKENSKNVIIDLFLLQFENEASIHRFFRSESSRKENYLIKDNTLSIIEYDSLYTEKQYLFLLKCLKNYSERIKPDELIFNKKKTSTEELEKKIKSLR